MLGFVAAVPGLTASEGPLQPVAQPSDDETDLSASSGGSTCGSEWMLDSGMV